MPPADDTDRNNAPTADHHVWFVAYDGMQSLDLAGPYEVFTIATNVADELKRPGPRYRCRVVSPSRTEIATESGLRFAVDGPGPAVPPPATLVIPGGDGVHDAADDSDLLAFVVDTAASAQRVATICSGTFLAAAAGIVDDHRVATHWARANRLARLHPVLNVERDALHVQDRNVWSSAGVTAGIDLALAMVEHDHDAEVAQIVARWLVVHLRRPGGQSPFAAPVWDDPSPVEPVRKAQELVTADPGADHRVERLAEAVGLSARHFTRVFTAEVGEPPARYVERVRVESVRRQLELGSGPLNVLADRFGFGTSETLRRAFHRRLGVSPADYRHRFSVQPAPQEPPPQEPSTERDEVHS